MVKDNHLQCRNILCEGFPDADSPLWKKADRFFLQDVVTGEKPFLSTEFSAFRCDVSQIIYFLFAGEDDAVQSVFRLRDEPIYREDVFEVFIADENDLSNYKELEVSPHDVLFDGLISYGSDGERRLNMAYDIRDWKTQTTYYEEKHRITSVWAVPYAAFSTPPQNGTSWRINAFRIDHSIRGISLQAWQKTGEPNFHVPSAFGYLDFI